MADKSKDKRKGKVTHIMANGEVRDTLKGYVFPPDALPDIAVRIFRQLSLDK